MADEKTPDPDTKPPGPDSGNSEPQSSAPAESPAAKSAAKDQAPKKRGPGRPKGSKNKAKSGASKTTATQPTESSEFKELRKSLEVFLTSPSFAFETVGETWPAQHVDKQGAVLAAEITAYAQRNPAFAARLKALLEGGENTKLIIAAVMYVAPLGIYFGVIPAPDRIKFMLGVPDRKPPVMQMPPADQMPEGMQEGLEAEAVEAGFTNPDGSPDIPRYLSEVQRAINEQRGVS